MTLANSLTKLVNLTPHAIVLMVGDVNITIPPSGIVARCASTRARVDTLTVNEVQIPVNQIGFGEVQGLPAPQDDVFFVVSSLVANAAKGRSDLLTVDDAVRDAGGNIIGCRALARTN
jgi:hypothetical protein